MKAGTRTVWTFVITSIALFMVVLDNLVVSTALPVIRVDLGASIEQLEWIVNAYTFTFAVFLLMGAALGDRFGRKRMFMIGLAVFTGASAMAALAPSTDWLIAARALQGFGGGISQPLGPAQLYRAFPPEEQGTALGIFGIALVFAPALGPILGGLLVDANLWRLIFFINVPIGILGVVLGSRFLLDYQAERKPSFDPLGLVTSAIGFGSILYAASIAGNIGWTNPETLTFFAIGIIALAAHAIIELYIAKDPMSSLRLFKNSIFLNAALVGYVATVALFGAEFLMPLYLQAYRGLTALETGFVLLAVAVTSGIATPVAGRIYDKIGPRMNLIVGFGILCINTWQLSKIESTTPTSYIIFLLALRGLAVGLTLQTSFVAALSSVPLNNLPRGSSLLNSTRFVVQAVAVAALATIFSASISPAIRAQQDQFQSAEGTSSVRFGICETPGVKAGDNLPPGASSQLGSLPATQAEAAKQKILSTLATVCQQSVHGFENAYRLTFFFSIGALIVGSLLPGWPGKWGGRGSMQEAPVAGGH